ncbi:MAG: sigma-70 family RNA polymerase sigma factor [Thermovirgaceae bacterium]|nr:sigma-70 family RNA polymerase sigma factor [Thermovirgaceae bacterium]
MNLWEEPDPELLKRCKTGEEKALAELLVAFTPLVRHIARGFAENGSADIDDLLQEGYISLIRAVNGYEKERGKFSSYMFSCARNGMISFLRKSRDRLTILPLFSDMAERMNLTDGPDEEEIADLAPEGLFRGLSFLETTVLDAFLETGSITRASIALEWPRKKVDNALQRIRRKVIANCGSERFLDRDQLPGDPKNGSWS